MYKKKINWLDSYNESLIYKDNLTCISCSPDIYNKNQREYLIKKSSIDLYYFNDVVANIRSSNFLFKKNGQLFLERVKDVDDHYTNYATGFVAMHDDKNAVIKFRRKSTYLSNILFLGGNGSFNYYHFLIEIIPKLFFLNSEIVASQNLKAIVCDSSIEQTETLKAAITMVLKFLEIDLPIVYISHKKNIILKKSVYINNFNNLVFNSKYKLSSVDYSHLNDFSLKKLRKTILDSCSLKCVGKNKIFLARRQSQNRSYNQNEIMSYFVDQGFHVLYMEDYTFPQQVDLFYNAECIVGPTGAAWANLIFCKPKCKGISWLSEQLSEFSVYSTLAYIFECDLKFTVTLESEDCNDIHSSYYVDLNKIKEIYRDIL